MENEMPNSITLPENANEEPKPPAPSLVKASQIEIAQRGIVLKSFDDLLRFANLAVSNGMAPKGMTAGAAAIAIQAGLERGLGLLGGLQQCVVINGVLSWRGQGGFALIQNSPVCKPGTLKMWDEGEGEEMKGVAVARRVGYSELCRREFTVEDARLAGLWGQQGPWRQYPNRQLMWRAFGFLGRDFFSDVLGGFPLAEEAADYHVIETKPERTVGKPSELPPPPTRDPLLDLIEGKVAEAIEVESVSITKAGEEPAQQSLLDLCPHGKKPMEECLDCGTDEANT